MFEDGRGANEGRETRAGEGTEIIETVHLSLTAKSGPRQTSSLYRGKAAINKRGKDPLMFRNRRRAEIER